MHTTAILALGLVLATAPVTATAGGTSVLRPFNYRGVTLDGGRLRQQVEEVKAYYLRIPNDDLLKPYRLRAGKAAPGADLKGVYVGHGTFGQFLGGLARLYAGTGDRACLQKAEALMDGWADCIGPDGYGLQARPIDLMPYHYEKLVGGLVDMIVYGHCDRAKRPLSRITDWAIANLSGVEKHINDTEGNWYMLNGEWYTLAENLYRAYQATGDDRYRTFARRFEYTDFWELVASGGKLFDRPGWKGWYHAYSHVNSFCGAGAAYGVTGDAHYLEILKGAYDFIQDQEAWATGGYGPNESLLPHSDLPGMLTSTGNHFETQCGSWAGFKITKYLVAFTGNARYGDWMERLLINGVGASIPMDAEGRVFYYSDYNLGGAAKKLIPEPWPCCSGTRIELTADYHDLLFLHDDNALYVSQFAPATVRWERPGGTVTAAQATHFPEEPGTTVTLKLDHPSTFQVCFRSPGWLASPMVVRVNGRKVQATAGSDHWVRVRRKWSSGDRVTAELPMALGLSRIDPKAPYPAAITYGPVVMAVRPVEGNPSRQLDLQHLATGLKPVAGQPLNYRAGKEGELLVRPFYQFAAGERYFVYLDPVRDFVRRSWDAYRFGGGWTDFNDWQTSSSPGSTVDFPFTGHAIRVHYFHYDDAGQAMVEVDGKQVGVLDEYAPERGVPASQEFTGLGPGSHTIRLTVLETTNPASKGRFLNLARFEPL